MKRLLTAAVGAPLVLLALFRLPATAFFWLIAALVCLAAWEFVRIVAHWVPGTSLWIVVPLVPLVALVLAPGVGAPSLPLGVVGLALFLSAGVGTWVLALRGPIEEGVPAMGIVSFGALYFGLPVAALAELQSRSPWLFVLLLAIVWLGDSAAFYVGTSLGRRRLAPVVSPKKSWEGAVAAAVTAVLAAVVWSAWRQQALDWTLIGLALITSIAAQLGDLVESLIKRGAGVKDSGTLLPGHGGFLDRFDALAFAAPVWWLALELTARLPDRP
jgi:phosphatidate cytidylyltransferase